jgi:hypothetical protein
MPNPVSLRDRFTSRRQLPASINEQPDIAAVARFTDRLAEFTSNDWLHVAAGAGHSVAARSAARAAIDAVVAEQGFGVPAWNAVDDVQTVSQCTYSEAGNVAIPKRIVAELRAARDLAAGAALALLVRTWLTPDQFDVLYQPFAIIVRS